MEAKWLEDFISLAETNSFSRSAELRHVTQPAFSRRIQALEAWADIDLVDRTSHPTCLTPAGRLFYEQAINILKHIYDTRELVQGNRPTTRPTVDFAVPHTLSLTYMPKLVSMLEAGFGAFNVRLTALNIHEAVLTMVGGRCDFLLSYYHPRQPLQLDPARYDMLVLGTENLRAYARCTIPRVPDYELPGTVEAPLPFLSYNSNAYLGRMVDVILSDAVHPIYLEKRYETDMAEGLKMMALEGRGIVFLPDSAVERELKQQRLAYADHDNPVWSVKMEIRLYRERKTVTSPNKLIVSQLWDYLTQAYSSSVDVPPSA